MTAVSDREAAIEVVAEAHFKLVHGSSFHWSEQDDATKEMFRHATFKHESTFEIDALIDAGLLGHPETNVSEKVSMRMEVRKTGWCWNEQHDDCDGRNGCTCSCHRVVSEQNNDEAMEYGLLNPQDGFGGVNTEAHLISSNRAHIEKQWRHGHPAIQFMQRRKAGPWIPAEEVGSADV